MKKIIVLNSYTLGKEDPGNLVRIKSFLKGLEDAGFSRGRDIEVDIIDDNDIDRLESSLKERQHQKIDLIHAVGTQNTAIAARFSSSIPIVYYGAHPEGVGAEECGGLNICGMTLTLPFTSNYKRFRFLKKLLPDVGDVYVPFYENTVFCPAQMKQKYAEVRRSQKGPLWQTADSPYVGFKTLAGLCYIVGVKYHEFLYRDSDELQRALEAIDNREIGRTMLMPYNDSVYCADAPGLLLRFAWERKIPLLWNNNPEATQRGAFAALSGCFKETGTICGSMAGRILLGEKPSQIGRRISTRSYASLNLGAGRHLGLEFPRDVCEVFDEILTTVDFGREA